jgi:hypothetical protein
MRAIFDKASHNTMYCEAVLGTMKHFRRKMQTGGEASVAAVTNAKMSKWLDSFDDLSPQAQWVLHSISARWQVHVAKHDEGSQALADSAMMARKLREMNSVGKQLALKWANAKVWHDCELLDEADVKTELDGLGSKTRKSVFLSEQVMIMSEGGGFEICAFTHCPSKGCKLCGDIGADRLVHLIEHHMKARGHVRKEGGMPSEAPRPSLTIKTVPPVLCDGDPTAAVNNNVGIITAGVNTMAEELVGSGKVKAEITRVGDVIMPELTAEVLVGKEIDMVFSYKQTPTDARWKKHTYRGKVVSIEKCPHTPTDVPTLAKRKRADGAKKKSRKTRKKQKAGGGERKAGCRQSSRYVHVFILLHDAHTHTLYCALY